MNSSRLAGDDADAPDARVDAVGQRKIDDPEFPAERHRGFGAPVRELLEAAAAPAGEHHGVSVAGQNADEAGVRFALDRAVIEMLAFFLGAHTVPLR
jgi:hypothetical protein